MNETGQVFFHSPCFDGIVSAVLTCDYFVSADRWREAEVHTVNYHLRDQWLERPLARPSAVVDFLYHPDTDFWADHHETSFLNDAVHEHFRTRRPASFFVYDNRYDSCAGLLWHHFHAEFGHRNARYAELVAWADKIDAAKYDSVEEAVGGDSPALQISTSLARDATEEYCLWLVRAFRDRPLEDVAGAPDVQQRYGQIRALMDTGLKRFRSGSRLEDGIVIFNVEATGAIVNRYAPFFVYRDASYSAGIIKSLKHVTLITMRNPWRHFTSVNLGLLCGEFGGGGHQRVGAIRLSGDDCGEAEAILDRIVARIRMESGFGS
jgi:hypothetical protein